MTNRSASPTPSQNVTTNAIAQTIHVLDTTPQSNLYLPALQSVLNTFPTIKSSSKSLSSSTASKSSNISNNDNENNENNTGNTGSTTSNNSSNNTINIKNEAQSNFLSKLCSLTKSSSEKILSETPTYFHLSPKDSAPQLTFTHDKLTIRGAYRGYRMSRGSHGISHGNWYFEVLVLDPPKVSEVVKALPKNVRLGESLKEGLRVGMMKERQDIRNAMLKQRLQQQQGMPSIDTAATSTIEEESKKKKRKLSIDDPSSSSNHNNASYASSISGHLRIGFSMRTGELQAPVGYDQWSYAYRDISGSRVHNSQREDKWGGESFGPGDVIGFAICLNDDNNYSGGSNVTNSMSYNNSTPGTGLGGMSNSNNTSNQPNSQQNHTTSSKDNTSTKNHIRFFKNGEGQGHFIVSRGTTTGGEAFKNIPKGTYYPAISPYMGGAARVNFGPFFIHPPKGLPSGMKVKPLSDLCPMPPKPDDVIEMFKREKVFGKKVDESIVNILHDAIRVEAEMRYENYQTRLEKNIMEVRDGRNARGLSTSDLPAVKKEEVIDMDVDNAEGTKS